MATEVVELALIVYSETIAMVFVERSVGTLKTSLLEDMQACVECGFLFELQMIMEIGRVTVCTGFTCVCILLAM